MHYYNIPTSTLNIYTTVLYTLYMYIHRSLEIDPADIKAVGITNQRETTIVWDKTTGQPLYNAIGLYI